MACRKLSCHGASHPVVVVVALALAALLCTAQLTSAKGIHVTVEASWNETSFLQEGCEWAGRSFGPGAFYACVDDLWNVRESNEAAQVNEIEETAAHDASKVIDARFSTQQAQYAAITAVAKAMGKSHMADHALFEIEMASRVYSPAVEAHYAMAAQALVDVSPSSSSSPTATSGDAPCACGEAFGVLYSRAVPSASPSSSPLRAWHICSAAALRDARAALRAEQLTARTTTTSAALLSAQEVSLPGLDYLYPSSLLGHNTTAVFVLYGLLGSPATRELHAASVAWVKATTVAAEDDGHAGLGGDAAAAAAPTLAYFLRHLPVSRTRLCGSAVLGDRAAFLSEQWDAPLAVQGYGVTVDIKNMEYKVLDEKAAAQQQQQQQAKEAAGKEGDTSVGDAAATAASLDLSDRVVGGLHFRRLTERYPHLSAALTELATRMDDEVGEGDLKVDFDVWELQNVGLAATQYIREVENSSHRLHVLKDVVNRFPLYAAALSRIAAQPARYETIQKTLAAARLRMQPGASALFVDGWRVEEKDLSLFGVLDVLRADEDVSLHVKRALTTRVLPRGEDAPAESARGIAIVNAVPALLQKVSSDVKRSTQRTGDASSSSSSSSAAPSTEEEASFAIPDTCITWLNSVETEQRYEGMSRHLSTFFVNTPGVTPFPRRNLLNYVFIWNPLLKSHLQMLTLIYRFNRQGLLARYGLVLLDPMWSPEIVQETAGREGQAAGFGGRSSLSRDVLAISAVAYHLQAGGGAEMLLEMLVQLWQASAKELPASDAVSSEAVMEACRRAASSMFDVSLEELMSDPGFLEHYHETQETIRRFPMPEYPAALLNGVVLDLSGAHLSTSLQQEVMRLRDWVASNALQDDTENLYTRILALRGAADHLQPALLRPPQTMRWTSTPELVAFIEDAPYLYSAAYAMDVPSLTQVLALPCHTSVATLRQVQTVLAALEGCAAVTKETDAHFAVCRNLRVTITSCPSTVNGAATTSTGTAADVSDYVVSLLRRLAERDVAEKKRYRTVQRYISHVLQALSSTPASAASAVVLDRATVAAALARNPLPADLQLEVGHAESVVRVRGRSDFRAALESAMPTHGAGVTLITNGRVIAMDDSFTASDVLEAARQVLPMTKMVEEAVLNVNFAEMTPAAEAVEGGYTAEEMDNAFYGGKVACLTSVLAHERATHGEGKTAPSLVREEALFDSAEARESMRAVSFSLNNTATSTAPGAEDGVSVHQVTAVVDPSSRDAQLIVSLISHLMHSPLRLRLTVLMNPSLDVKFPIRDFYEYVATATVRFDDATGRVVAPAATFSQLPSTALLTLGVEEPPTWTVFSQEAEEDLDNILLSKLSPGTPFVFAVYRMHSLLVTGDATDAVAGGPPDGLPLSLTPAQASSAGEAATYTRSTDTQVMANQNGYYQLQAAPGLWLLSVKPGPIAAAYCIESVGAHSIAACATGNAAVNFTQGQRIPVVIDSFSGRYLSLRVRHTPPALPASESGGGRRRGGSGNAVPESLQDLLQKRAVNVKYSWPPSWLSRGAKPRRPERPTLNIFSVASGHLYERFLRMMFYSVHKTSSDTYGANTTRIKFWVIENFLSPQFKRYIPLLAAELGFEVGFVTYRWPWWLPRQTEKQRKIWAYKILFLDVLFPLDVDRVIFVDADQTAQADLHELYNMDIGGSPVAMTPFCQTNRNEATMRFRFWEHGYWVDHLKGKPYHISAIFLVDLLQFRARLAGDRYRSTYANLAGDPNSLSNLDQDLPNYVQASIPIFSLPEQWLWCETWCSAKSKSKAKTIDLCNNPLTKMPKLDNAKMVIPNWEAQDNMLQNMSDALLARL